MQHFRKDGLDASSGSKPIQQPDIVYEIVMPAGISAGQTFFDNESKKSFRRCGNEICNFIGLQNDW
jgi:hypothetical protein